MPEPFQPFYSPIRHYKVMRDRNKDTESLSESSIRTGTTGPPSKKHTIPRKAIPSSPKPPPKTHRIPRKEVGSRPNPPKENSKLQDVNQDYHHAVKEISQGPKKSFPELPKAPRHTNPKPKKGGCLLM